MAQLYPAIVDVTITKWYYTELGPSLTTAEIHR